MASKIKISELPALTGTVEDSYNIPIDDGSTTYKVSVSHFEEAAAHTASQYAAAAAESAEAAAGSAGEAATTATTIETDIGTATRLVNDARGYASSAADSVAAAQAASGAATTKANEASNSANAAAGSAGEAAASATTASNYVTNAQAEADRAKSWADYPNATGSYGDATHNAHYWADVAQAIAGGGVTSFNGRGGVVVPEAGDYSAGMISYDNTSSGLTATDAQAAIDEVNTDLGNLDTEVGQIETDLSDYEVLPSKNRAIPNGTRRTLASVTYTQDANGVIDADGTATGGNSFYYISERIEWPNEQMVLSGCPSGGDANTYRLIVASSEDSGASVYASDTGSGVIVPANTGGSTLTLDIYIRIAQNASVSHKKFSPMFCSKAEYDADPTYEPYFLPMRDGKLDIADYAVNGAVNHFNNTIATQTVNTVVWTKDETTKKMTANGTASGGNSTVYCNVTLEAGTWYLTGCPQINASGDTKVAIQAYLASSPYTSYGYDTGNGLTITLAAKTTLTILPIVYSGKTVSSSSCVFDIMISNIKNAPYVPYAMTNRELTDMSTVIPVADSEFSVLATGVSISNNWSCRYGKLLNISLTIAFSSAINAFTNILEMPNYYLGNGKTGTTAMTICAKTGTGSQMPIAFDVPAGAGSIKIRNSSNISANETIIITGMVIIK